MLHYPITSKPIYLFEENSLNLKKADKSKLINPLLSQIDKNVIVTADDGGSIPSIKTDAIVIDFMAVLRKMVAVQLSNVTTFGSLCDCIMGIITSYSKKK